MKKDGAQQARLHISGSGVVLAIASVRAASARCKNLVGSRSPENQQRTPATDGPYSAQHPIVIPKTPTLDPRP